MSLRHVVMVQQSLVSSDHLVQGSSFFCFESLGCYFSGGITLYSSLKNKNKSNYNFICLFLFEYYKTAKPLKANSV